MSRIRIVMDKYGRALPLELEPQTGGLWCRITESLDPSTSLLVPLEQYLREGFHIYGDDARELGAWILAAVPVATDDLED